MLNLPQEVYVSTIEVIDDNIWISSIGSGIYVYNTKSFICLSSWGVKDQQHIFAMLHVADMSLVLALTKNGIFSFSSTVKNGFDYLQPQNFLEVNFSPLSINVGVYIPPELNIYESQAWVCSHTRHEFFILDPSTLEVIKEYSTKSSDQRVNHNIMHLQTLTTSGRMKLAVADNWMLHLWDVEKRQVEQTFNCRQEKGLKRYKLTGIMHLHVNLFAPPYSPFPEYQTEHQAKQ